jgi:hypothetical protein
MAEKAGVVLDRFANERGGILDEFFGDAGASEETFRETPG